MNQTIKVEAYSKEAREDRNGNKIWGVLYKPSPNAQGTWINVHREQQPRKGESITGDLEEQKDKNGKSWWHLHVRLENPPKLAPESPPPLQTPQYAPVQESGKPTFDQILEAIRGVKNELGPVVPFEAIASVMQTVIIQISLGNIVPPDPFKGDAHDDGTIIEEDRTIPPWEQDKD